MLEGPAGTGKTLVALQVAMNLMESANNSCEEDENKKPFLVVTAGQKGNDLITKFLDANSGAADCDARGRDHRPHSS